MTEQFQLCQHFTEHFIMIIKITDFYKVFRVFKNLFGRFFAAQCAAKVIKEECYEASITISSYGKRFIFLKGAADHVITLS